ncbi:uncharacterized protein LOC130738003 isoform X2 [Lotus japonicus]|uniref:uncharacterized protein LOC130738003 isoform X2 n=1 Tax=Lotus japonicus TaxID=34305 RepID=UPI00258CC50C|nr:uncharacterized protein LOC130738003 isoform X2 [Lotus japonicus]
MDFPVFREEVLKDGSVLAAGAYGGVGYNSTAALSSSSFQKEAAMNCKECVMSERKGEKIQIESFWILLNVIDMWQRSSGYEHMAFSCGKDSVHGHICDKP